VESKPYTLKLEGKPSIFAKGNSTSSAGSGSRGVKPKSWILVSGVAISGIVALVVIIGAVAVALVIRSQKQQPQ